LLTDFPILFKINEKTPLLAIIKGRVASLSLEVIGCISPYPTELIVVIAQYKEYRYKVPGSLS